MFQVSANTIKTQSIDNWTLNAGNINGAPFILPAFKVQLSILCVLIVLALTWNIQGGEMGYNSFGNILFYGLGMYLCASVQVGMFFPLAEWTESGGEKTFIHTPTQFFQGMAAGLVVAAATTSPAAIP